MDRAFRKITVNTLISYSGRAITSVFALIIIGLLTRSLGAKGFGEYTTVVAFLSMFVILSDMGLQALMTREISRLKDDVTEIASSFFTLRLLSSAVFLLAGVVFSLAFPYSDAVKLGMMIAAVGMFFLSVNQLLIGVFQKHLAMHLTVIAEILGRGVQLLLVYLAYAFYAGRPTSHTSLFLFLGAMSAASLLIFAIQYLFARKYIKIGWRVDFVQWRQILKKTWPVALSIVLTLVYFKIDTIFLSVMKSQDDVGIYGAAYRVLESLLFFPAMFAGIMLPLLSREAVESNLDHFRETFVKTLRIMTIFAVPLAAGGIVLAYSVANLIGGREFLAAGAPLQVLSIAIAVIFLGNLFGRAVIALDLQKRAVLAYLFGVVLNIVLNLIFIPKYTYMGAAWTTVATELLITIFLFWLIWVKVFRGFKSLGGFWGGRGIGAIGVAAGTMAATLYFLASPISEPLSFEKLVFLIMLGAGVYFGVLYILSGRRVF